MGRHRSSRSSLVTSEASSTPRATTARVNTPRSAKICDDGVVREGTRRHRKAIERQMGGYRVSLRSAPTVEDNEWVSQFDAADRMGVSMARVGFLIQGGRLEPAHNQAGEAGVRKPGVDREAARRSGAGHLRRGWLLLGDFGRSLAGSI